MTTGGRFYREKFKPPAIQYIEEHFPQYFQMMEQMTENYVAYVAEMSQKVAVYLEQTIPVRMNCEGTLSTVAANVDFITPVITVPAAIGLIDADFSNLAKAFLLMIGRVVNLFDGVNNLDCTVAANNQWMLSVGAGAYADLQNAAKADGQMLDTDWECQVLGSIHPFTFLFDITDRLTAIDNAIGVRLAGARSRQDNLIVTVDVYMKVVWKL